MAEPSDPFEILKRQETSDLRAPLPPAEVRARGDRMRRRRTAFRAVAAAAAVAVVTTAGVAMGGGMTRGVAPIQPAGQSPPPEPSAPGPTTETSFPASRIWVTEIPEDFPLEEGLPAESTEVQWTRSSDERHPFAWDPCHLEDEQPLLGARVDWRSVHVGYPAGAQLRQLALFADQAAAERAYDDYFLGSLADCGVYRYEDGVSEDRWLTLPVEERPDISGQAVAVSHAWTGGMRTPLATHFVVTHVGNAILVSAVDGEFGATDASTKELDAQARAAAQPLLDAMCVFSSDGCPSPVDDRQSKATEEAAEEAAEDARRATFGPDGFAGVALGMTSAEIEATGRVTLEHGSQPGCSDFALLSPDGSEPIGGGYLSAENGVELISVTSKEARTPEGITLTSTLDEVFATYPDGRWFDPTYVTPVPGHQDRQYSFVFAGGEATGLLSMGVHLRDSSCSPNVSGR
jgi:hypothetical protein